MLLSPSLSIVLPDDFQQSNVLPPVKSLCASGEVDCQNSVCQDSASSKVLDVDEVGDLFDQSDLLEELRELNNMQESSSKSKDDSKPEEKLFPNSQLSVKETVILLLGIITRHHLSGVALDDILALINLICPKENKMPSDAKEVFSFFQTQSQKIIKHFYCPNKNCQVYAGHTKISEQESCGVCKSKLKEEAMFLEIPIQDQLKTVLSGTLCMDTGQD